MCVMTNTVGRLRRHRPLWQGELGCENLCMCICMQQWHALLGAGCGLHVVAPYPDVSQESAAALGASYALRGGPYSSPAVQ